MRSSTKQELNRTPLYESHLDAGARMVEFAGWAMPIQYSGILDEHRAVRAECGLFDVSHMGRLEFTGSGALDFLQRCLVADVASLDSGRAQYTLLCLENGGILDDAIIYRTDEARSLLVCNAANRHKVVEWLESFMAPYSVTLEDHTEATVMLALQGPKAVAHMESLLGGRSLETVSFLDCLEVNIGGSLTLVARTGYTGEDGFEIIANAAQGERLWSVLRDRGVKPCGLGARDTLRLEAALLLHGHDMGPDVNPYEAGLGWVVNLDNQDFVARDALIAAKEQGLSRRLCGFEMTERAIPRAGYAMLKDGSQVGVVTSGGFSPTLERGIGLGYVSPDLAAAGTELHIDIRGSAAPARVVRRPFYRRS